MTKLAYLFGLNYSDTQNPLNGCHNDVDNMALFLRSKGWMTFVYKDNEVTISRKFILNKLLDLVLSNSNELFFHFSGHGSQQIDTNKDEIDGNDEGLVVYDEIDKSKFELVIDDELKGIVSCIKPTQKLTLFLDCCHSGTMCDLTFGLYQKWNSVNSLMLVKDGKNTETNGQVVVISGCLDNQYSSDAFIGGKYQGACTRAFLDCYSDKKSWERLILDMQNYMKMNKYEQIPQLSSGKLLNLKSLLSF